MTSGLKRRQFVALFGAAAVWPFAGAAQQLPVIGFLSSRSAFESEALVAAFRQGLNEAGYAEGRNAVIEYHWAENQYDRLPGLVAQLVRSHVAVIVAAGGVPSAFSAKGATTTIPIVFTSVGDPAQLGLVASLNRPGGNITGSDSTLTTELDSKRLQLLRELVPTATVIAALVNPDRPLSELQVSGIQKSARILGQEVIIVRASAERDLDAAFTTLTQQHAGALLVGTDPFFASRREQIVALAARYAVPASYQWRDFAVAGGLMSYGGSLADGYRQAGIYTGRILKGENPADLPVMQPTKFEFVVNLKTAQALGLTIPPSILARADEVIE
jgi:putative tryptophan/tyrosine transport system substrate-binding protein